jgi:hypothetical protein
MSKFALASNFVTLVLMINEMMYEMIVIFLAITWRRENVIFLNNTNVINTKITQKIKNVNYFVFENWCNETAPFVDYMVDGMSK